MRWIAAILAIDTANPARAVCQRLIQCDARHCWQGFPQAQKLEKNFSFRDHHETLAFVNALSWISHRENHHPELTVGYRDCRVRYWTHAIGDLSENDFICAAKIERLLEI